MGARVDGAINHGQHHTIGIVAILIAMPGGMHRRQDGGDVQQQHHREQSACYDALPNRIPGTGSTFLQSIRILQAVVLATSLFWSCQAWTPALRLALALRRRAYSPAAVFAEPSAHKKPHGIAEGRRGGLRTGYFFGGTNSNTRASRRTRPVIRRGIFAACGSVVVVVVRLKAEEPGACDCGRRNCYEFCYGCRELQRGVGVATGLC